MIGALLALLATAPAAESEVEGPSDQTLIYYNARMALREGEALEAIKLWLLRNAVEDRTGQISPHDGDFHSITWAALGELGICQDGYPTDDRGAGLWPLALHNWVVQNRRRRLEEKPKPFDAYQVGQQQRFVAIQDVLSLRELDALELFRGTCVRPRLTLIDLGEPLSAELADPAVAGRMLLALLDHSRGTLVDGKVRGQAAIEARRFDLYLQLASLASRDARQEASEQAREARVLGMSREALLAMREEAPVSSLPADSEPARILQEAVAWPPWEWMALEPERRLFLFQSAREYSGEAEALDQTALGIVDRLIARGDGVEVTRWIGMRGAEADPGPVWAGERGQRLLALDRESGFRERGVIALHRGVAELQRGELDPALRSLAFALQQAPESAASDEVRSLSLRWMTYVAARFEITDELLITLQELVPPRDYAVLLEDLMWRAAFRADAASFARGLKHQQGRGALERRLELLHPLADGDVGRFLTLVRGRLQASPSETLRFLDQAVERLELEEAEVRSAHAWTLVQLRGLLEPLTWDVDGRAGRQSRTAAALLDRTQAILQGLDALGEGSDRDRARALSPSSEVFAGSVRLAPVDPLPWPFKVPEAQPPSVFDPLPLTPEEWHDEQGRWVMGWRIGG